VASDSKSHRIQALIFDYLRAQSPPNRPSKQPGASTTVTRYWVLSDTKTFWEVAVATEEIAIILMSANLWKAAPAADSRRVPRFEQGFVGEKKRSSCEGSSAAYCCCFRVRFGLSRFSKSSASLQLIL